MIPIAIYEALAGDSGAGSLDSLGITSDRIVELQSVTLQDERPFDSGYWIVVDFQEEVGVLYYDSEHDPIGRTPRNMQIWVHTPYNDTRDYAGINAIMNRVDAILVPMAQEVGTDGVRVSCVRPQGRSGNLDDPGWETLTRNANYGVLYDRKAA